MSFSPTAAAGDAVILEEFVLLRVIFPYRSTNEWVEDKDSYVDDDDDDDCDFYGDEAMILAMITRWWWQDDYN